MKADNTTTEHNRTIHVTELPTKDEYDLTEITITVNYTGEGNASKGITLDHIIIPAIVEALNREIV